MRKLENNLPSIDNCFIAIIGLGYVGLPLACEFAKTKICKKTDKKLNRSVIGFDLNTNRINQLINGIDITNEVNQKELKKAIALKFTNCVDELINCDVFIVTVPTPIDKTKNPDLSYVSNASITVGNVLKKRTKNNNPIIIYESTVYPGATEEVFIPILEKQSKLKLNENFYVGYSPERINPGDKEHRLSSIVKITSGSNECSSNWINSLYGSIIKAGTYKTSSIKIAEAAKVIENTQRDINIALVNELSYIFKRLDIDTLDVLEAARTKWNFLDFRPGLVGGHCIGVDPYYLTYKAQEVGYKPEIVLAGRNINDKFSKYIVEQIVLKMSLNALLIGGTKVLVLGFTFKENCPDIRNTKVLDIVKELIKYGMQPEIVDPLVDIDDCRGEYNLEICHEIPEENYQVIILAVAHEYFKKIKKEQWESLLKPKGIIFDIKGLLPKEIGAIRV